MFYIIAGFKSPTNTVSYFIYNKLFFPLLEAQATLSKLTFQERSVLTCALNSLLPPSSCMPLYTMYAMCPAIATVITSFG